MDGNEQTMLGLRAALEREVAASEARLQHDSAQLNEISRINNELVNTQRELAGQNAELLRLNQALDEAQSRARGDADIVKASERRYRRLFEAARDGILILDVVTCQIIDVNPFMVELLGYTRDEFVGKELWEIGLLKDEEASASAFRELQDNGYIRYEDLPLQAKGGQYRAVEFVSNVYAENGHQVIQCNIRDVTQRQQMDATSARLAAIVESSQDAIISKTLDGIITTWNAGAEALYGYTDEEAIGRPVSFLAPADLAGEMPQLLAKIRRGELVRHYETVRLRKDGSRFDISLSISPLKDPQGHIIGASSIKRDISERRQAEAALRKNETKYRTIFETALDAILLADDEGRYVDANSAGCTLLGVEHEQLMGRSIADFVSPEIQDATRVAWNDFLRDGQQSGVFEFQRPNGEQRQTEFRAVARLLPGLHLSILRDTTERKQAEAKLRESAARKSAIFEAALDCIISMDHAGHIIEFNSSAEKTFGYTRDEAIGQLLADLIIPPAIREHHQRGLEHYLATGEGPILNRRIEVSAMRADGTEFPTELSISPVNLGERTIFTAYLRDITERKQAELALRHSELRYRSLALATAQIVWTTTAQGEVVEDLPAWRAYTGQSVEEISGLGWIQAVHPDDQEDTANAWLDAVQTKTAYQVECRMRSADGTYRLFMDRGVPVVDSNGQVREWVGTCTDLTELKQAEAALQTANNELEKRVEARTAELEQANAALRVKDLEQQRVMEILSQSEERFRLLVESVHDYAILMLDPAGRVMTWNAGAERMKGYHAEEIIGQHFSRFYTAADQQAGQPEQELRTAAAEGYMDDEGWRVRRDGSRFWATVVITALRDAAGELRGFAKVSRDITERRNMEDALREAKVQADTANLAKSEFLSRMSHELRTPLNAILGFGQLLAKQDFAPAQKERVQHILKAGRHLLDLINEVLEIARIEAGHMLLSMEPVLVSDTVQEVYSLVRPLAAERGIELQGGDSDSLAQYVQADRQRLKQVLLNLCSNAIKYNRPQGTVTIFCETMTGAPTAAGKVVPQGHMSGDQLRVKVTDTGLGIAAASQAQLFLPFMRVGAEQTTIEGTGLGLALSLSLMQAMGGTIGVESTVGVGSTFWLQLPLAQAPLLTAPLHPALAAPLAPVSATRYTLLYIEDNLSNLQLIEAILADQLHYELLSAMQGQVGLDLARQHHPDLILLDLHLPDVPGDQVLARLKADPATAGIPVVMLSAVATPSEIKRLLDAGATEYLTKPLDVEKFLVTIADVLKSTEGQRPTVGG